MPGFDNNALAAAHSLRAELQNGGEPVPQVPVLRLYEGEQQYFYSGARILGWEGKDVRYTTFRPKNLSPDALAIAHIIDVGQGANPWFYVLMCYLGLNNRNPQL